MDNRIMMLLPNVDQQEYMFLESLMKEVPEQQQEKFILLYRGNRKDPQNILLFTILGFFGVAGVQRFVINQIGMGVLFLLTMGFCFIGTIVDLVNYKKLAFEHNQREAYNTLQMLKIM
jgi:TM2 domain-containing membrane protein YozV